MRERRSVFACLRLGGAGRMRFACLAIHRQGERSLRGVIDDGGWIVETDHGAAAPLLVQPASQARG